MLDLPGVTEGFGFDGLVSVSFDVWADGICRCESGCREGTKRSVLA